MCCRGHAVPIAFVLPPRIALPAGKAMGAPCEWLYHIFRFGVCQQECFYRHVPTPRYCRHMLTINPSTSYLQGKPGHMVACCVKVNRFCPGYLAAYSYFTLPGFLLFFWPNSVLGYNQRNSSGFRGALGRSNRR